MTLTEYLLKLKMLLGIEPDVTLKDVRLIFTIETVIQDILTYCNITVIPKALENVVLQIAEDYYRSKYPTEFQQTAASVVSVKRGDVQTNFGSAKTVVTTGPGATFVQNYAEQLTNFRRLRW